MNKASTNLITVVLLLLTATLPASATDEALIEILRTNGVITSEQYESLKKAEKAKSLADHAAPTADEDLLKILLENGSISQAQYAALRNKTMQEKRTEAEVTVALQDSSSRAQQQEVAAKVSNGPAVEQPSNDGTPIASTGKTAPGPSPIGSEQDLATVPGGIENLRKRDYRDVFTSLEDVAKHSERLSVGIVALKAQYIADSTKISPGTSPGTVDPAPLAPVPRRDKNGFRMRAVEFYATGRLTDWSTYYAEFDFARQNEIALNAMYMDFYLKDMPHLKSAFPYVSKLRIGQFREPFGIEQGTSQGVLDFVNRAYYTDLKLGAVDIRTGDPTLNPFGKDNGTGFMQQLDMGAMLAGKVSQLPWEPEYELAVINGAGRNFNDNNSAKDFSGRLIFKPTEGLKVYLAGYYGHSFFNGKADAVLHNNTDVRKTRLGIMYTYFPPFFHNLVKLQGEYMEGHDSDFHRRTWYQYVLFRPLSFLPNFEPAYRYERFTVDTNRPNSTLSRHTIGFNYYLHTDLKLTVNYEIKQDENGGGSTNPNNNNFFATQLQFRY